MSGLSIGKNPALRFCQASAGLAIPAKTRCWEDNLLRFVDGFLETLAGRERGQRFGVDLDLFSVHRTAPGARLALAREESAEADHSDALAFRHVVDDRVEHGVYRFTRCCPAEIACLCCDLHEIGLRHHVWHSFLSPAFNCGADRIQTKMERQ